MKDVVLSALSIGCLDCIEIELTARLKYLIEYLSDPIKEKSLVDTGIISRDIAELSKTLGKIKGYKLDIGENKQWLNQ